MYHYIYQVYLTNPESSMFGKLYFGKHSTNNILDGYIGSGKLLKRYLKKYPNDYYRKILHLYNSTEELNKAEYELIHKHFGKPYSLNLCEGGQGGNTIILYDDVMKKQVFSKISLSHIGHKQSLESRQKISKTKKEKCASGEIVPWIKGKSKENNIKLKEASEKISKTRKEKCASGEIVPWNKNKKCPQLAGENNGMFGKNHTEEEKINQSKRMKLYHQTHKKVLCEDGKYHFFKKKIK